MILLESRTKKMLCAIQKLICVLHSHNLNSAPVSISLLT